MDVLRPYVFLGFAYKTENIEEAINEAQSGCKIFVFSNSKERVILMEHDSHLESLLSLALSLEERCDFGRTFFGCEVRTRSSLETKGSSSFNLIVVPIQNETNLFVEAWGDLFLRVFRMLGRNWVFVHSGMADAREQAVLEILRKFSLKETLGLSLITKYERPHQAKKSRHDPLRAASREARYQLLHARSYLQQELACLTKDIESIKLHRSIPILNYRFQLIHQVLRTEIDKIDNTLAKLGSEVEAIQDSFELLDEFESLKDIYKLPRLGIKVSPKDREQLLEYEEVFSIEDAFAFDAYNSVGLKGSCPIVIPSKGYYYEISKRSDNVRLIELPISMGLRLGLLPILYHIVSRLLVEEIASNDKSYFEEQSKELEELVNKSLKNTGRNIKTEIKSVVNELMADVIAAEVAGPAYFYALLRGFFFDPVNRKTQVIGIKERLNNLLLLFERRGFNLKLESQSAKLTKASLDMPDLTSMLLEATSKLELPSTYTIDVHKSTTLGVKASLISGKVVAAKPCVVSNALWEAVVEKRAYLNENAAFLSVLEWVGHNDVCRIQ